MCLAFCGNVSFEKLEIESRSTKIIYKSLKFVSKFGFMGPLMMEIITRNVGNAILAITVLAQKYRPFWVSVSHQNQNRGLGRILECIACCCRFQVVCIGNRKFLVRQNYLFIDYTSRN